MKLKELLKKQAFIKEPTTKNKVEVIGMILMYSDVHLGKVRNQEDYYTLRLIQGFKTKTGSTETDYKKLGKEMIKHFNNTLVKGERPRKFKTVYIHYKGEYFL